MRMLMLAEEKGYKLEGEIDRVTTKTTPKDIEDELRRKRWLLTHCFTNRITPKELQFRNPLDARNHVRRRMSK